MAGTLAGSGQDKCLFVTKQSKAKQSVSTLFWEKPYP
jgi:hypothetical protein